MADTPVKPYESILPRLLDAKAAWENLTDFINQNYVMEEHWFEGKPESNYHSELKFRRGGKTLITLYIREGYFGATVILGKDERAKCEERRGEFSSALLKIYDETNTLHDGKWLWIVVHDMSMLDDIFRLLAIKRKPNRKTAEIK